MGKSKICNACRKPVNPDDKFCQHCGAPLKNIKPTSESVPVKQVETLAFTTFFKWGILALIVGLCFGWVRYWIGYYILIQGVIAGLIIPYLVVQITPSQKNAIANIRFKMALFLFFSFMVGQLIGFGVAQPVFDPFNWVARVWNGDTSESVFGIFSTGGVVHGTFSEGLSGGFWAFLWFIDLFFMFFFMLVSMPLTSKKTKS